MDKRGMTYKKEVRNILVKQKKYRDAEFSANSLAECLGVPNYKVSRIFKTEFKMTYSDFVLSMRVNDAKKYLRSKRFKKYSVDDIAVVVGFKNRQSFFDAFHKYANTTPDKFRREAAVAEYSLTTSKDSIQK